MQATDLEKCEVCPKKFQQEGFRLLYFYSVTPIGENEVSVGIRQSPVPYLACSETCELKVVTGIYLRKKKEILEKNKEVRVIISNLETGETGSVRLNQEYIKDHPNMEKLMRELFLLEVLMGTQKFNQVFQEKMEKEEKMKKEEKKPSKKRKKKND